MRQKLITLDPVTWELAQKKPNFSEWVRNQLRSERNKNHVPVEYQLEQRRLVEEKLEISTSRLLYELEQRSESEIRALLSILKGSLDI